MMWFTIKEYPNVLYKMKYFSDRKGLFCIRDKCAIFIDERMADITADTKESVALQFYNDLEAYIRQIPLSEKDFSTMINPLRHISPMELYTHFINGHALENQFIDEVTRSDQINKLECIQNIIKSCNEFYQISNNFLQAETDELYDPVSYITNNLQEYEIWRDSVVGELNHWQRKQISEICCLDSEGEKKVIEMQTEKLNNFQNCFELLFEVTTKLLQMIEYLKTQSPFLMGYGYTELDQLVLRIVKEQENLMMKSFVIVNQPHQVIKTATNFFCSVRWLLGPRVGSHYMNSPVQCIVVSEAENKFAELPTELQNSKVSMDYDEQNRILSANFKSLSLKKIPRGGHKGNNDSVMDEKLALLFYLTKNNSICALSLPVVVIVHGNQEHQASATIMWDNAFSKVGRHLFTVPDRVSWTELAEALYSKCFAVTKRGFSDANRKFIYEQLFSINNRTMSSPSGQEILWVNFSKEDLFGRSFTFWEWFYHAIKLVKVYLLKPWQNNLIEGFISRNEAERKLSHTNPGTFLLRFSESFMGSITVSYNSGNNQIVHIQPWDSKELHNKCLGDRIQECLDIIELYPYGIHKSEFIEEFGRPVNQPDIIINGYVAPLTLTVINPTQPENSSHNNNSHDMSME